MTETIINSAAMLLQSAYPGLTADGLREALEHRQDAVADMTIKEAMDLLKVCRRSIYNMADNGLIKVYKIGGSVRVDGASVASMIADAKGRAV